VQLKAGVKHRRQRVWRIVFQTNDIQMTAIVFVKFVEFVASKNHHEFHELNSLQLFSGVHDSVH